MSIAELKKIGQYNSLQEKNDSQLLTFSCRYCIIVSLTMSRTAFSPAIRRNYNVPV